MNTTTVTRPATETTRSRIATAAIVLAALGSAITAGVFYAFSAFVMAGLDRQTDAVGLAAMQGINETAPKAPLLIVMFGTALFSIVAMIAKPKPLVFAAGFLFLVGTIGVTMVGNVPLNDELVPLDPQDASAQEIWRDYLVNWTRWNTVRTVAPALAAAALIWQLVRGR